MLFRSGRSGGLVFHLFQNFIVIHTVKGFGIVNKAEVGVPHLSNLFSRSSGALMSLPIFVNNDPSFLLQNVLESF